MEIDLLQDLDEIPTDKRETMEKIATLVIQTSYGRDEILYD